MGSSEPCREARERVGIADIEMTAGGKSQWAMCRNLAKKHGISKHNPHRSVSDLCGLVLDAPVWVSGGFLE